MVAMNVMLCAINLYVMGKLRSERHDERAFEVPGVGHDDEYLRYVLHGHGADITKHQPDLVWDGPRSGSARLPDLALPEMVGPDYDRVGFRPQGRLRPARLMLAEPDPLTAVEENLLPAWD